MKLALGYINAAPGTVYHINGYSSLNSSIRSILV